MTKHFGQTIKIARGCNLLNPPHPPYNVEGNIYRAKCCLMASTTVQGGERKGYGLYTRPASLYIVYLSVSVTTVHNIFVTDCNTYFFCLHSSKVPATSKCSIEHLVFLKNETAVLRNNSSLFQH
jgi:hypothetical protein